MEHIYTTSELAKLIGIHPNTVRLYEELGLITKPRRRENGYRIFTRLHLIQLQIARLAFEVEILQNGLRKLAVELIKACAMCDFDRALGMASDYLFRVEEERQNAESAIRIVEQIMAGETGVSRAVCLTRKQTAGALGVTIDTLRNWELNGLIDIKRRQNGYRVYDGSDIRRLTIIKSLRCANYSLSAILRMLRILSGNPQADVREAMEASQSDYIITACDNLITSLNHAESNMKQIHSLLKELKVENFQPSILPPDPGPVV